MIRGLIQMELFEMRREVVTQKLRRLLRTYWMSQHIIPTGPVLEISSFQYDPQSYSSNQTSALHWPLFSDSYYSVFSCIIYPSYHITGHSSIAKP